MKHDDDDTPVSTPRPRSRLGDIVKQAVNEAIAPLTHRISEIERNLGAPANPATGEKGKGLIRVVGDLATRGVRRDAAIASLGILAAILLEVGIALATGHEPPKTPVHEMLRAPAAQDR